MKYNKKNKNRNDDILKRELFGGLACLILALLLGMTHLQQQREALASRLAPSVLRFHILANSDSDADQTVKLEVRSLVLDFLAEQKPENKADTIRLLEENRAAIEQTANTCLARQGFPYQARLQITRDYFPTRVYDKLVIPCGYYDAARITLGRGDGHNWWCVLYPRFCFLDAACQEVPGDSLHQLQETLNQDDFLALEDHRPDLTIRFFLFPSFSKPVGLNH